MNSPRKLVYVIIAGNRSQYDWCIRENGLDPKQCFDGTRQPLCGLHLDFEVILFGSWYLRSNVEILCDMIASVSCESRKKVEEWRRTNIPDYQGRATLRTALYSDQTTVWRDIQEEGVERRRLMREQEKAQIERDRRRSATLLEETASAIGMGERTIYGLHWDHNTKRVL